MDIHATQIHIQIRLSRGGKPTDKAGIVAPVILLLLQNEPESILFRKSADCRRRMQQSQDVAQHASVGQCEFEDAFQVRQFPGTHRIGTFLVGMYIQCCQLPAYIRGDQLLLLTILAVPAGRQFALQQPLRACQGDRLPILPFPCQDDFGGTAHPCARPGRMQQIDIGMEVTPARLEEGTGKGQISPPPDRLGAGQHQFVLHTP